MGKKRGKEKKNEKNQKKKKKKQISDKITSICVIDRVEG